MVKKIKQYFKKRKKEKEFSKWIRDNKELICDLAEK
jgi:hypothetical protein